jgi:hypothetical protein
MIESEVRCGDGRGCSSSFYWGQGSTRGGGRKLITDVNGFNAIEGINAR